MVIPDEAGRCPTRTRLALQRAVDAVDGRVVDVGEPSADPVVDVGGGHYTLASGSARASSARTIGSATPVYRDAAELLRDRHPAAAVEVLRTQGAVSDHHATPVEAWVAMVGDWLILRDGDEQVLMLATPTPTTWRSCRCCREADGVDVRTINGGYLRRPRAPARLPDA